MKFADANVTTIKKGTLALCSRGALGLITHDEPQRVTYPDGSKGFAYIGIHLTDKISPIGSPWSSRTPRPVAILETVNGDVYRVASVWVGHVVLSDQTTAPGQPRTAPALDNTTPQQTDQCVSAHTQTKYPQPGPNDW
jgi:hypothetical protein